MSSRRAAAVVAVVGLCALLATGWRPSEPVDESTVDRPATGSVGSAGSAGPAGSKGAIGSAARKVVVVAAGDIADCAGPRCPATRTARRVRLIGPDVVLVLGDNQYPSGSFADFRREYHRSWGRFWGRTRPVPGNHEYRTRHASGYFRYFRHRAHRGHGGYYSFNNGGWHLVALNSNDGMCRAVRCGPGSAQVRWLRRDLHRTDRRCVLAYWHHPPWSTGHHGDYRSVRALWRPLARQHADVVLNAHDHSYERFGKRGPAGRPHPLGVRQFVVGTGGAELRGFSHPRVRLDRARVAGRHGVLKLVLRPGSFRWAYVTATGAVLDRGGPVGCH